MYTCHHILWKSGESKENQSSGFPTRSDSNRSVQSQMQARSLKFWKKVEEELSYPCSESKGADQLICTFVFAYAKVRFSHDAAHMKS